MQPCPEEAILSAFTTTHRAIAQLVERRSPKPQVGGSSPSRPAHGPVAQRQLHLAVNETADNLRGFESLPACVNA